MHKKVREGVDIEVAFASQMKRASVEPSRVKNTASIDGWRDKAAALLRSRARSVLQRFARLAQKIARPIRRYLAFPVQEELQTVRETLQREMRAQIRDLGARLDRIARDVDGARRVAIYCGPEEVLIRSEVGYILCSPREHKLLTFLLEGELERGTRLLIQKLLAPGDVFIDVGANVGLHTLAAARAMQGVGRVVAFEPFEPTKCLLEKSVRMNGFSGIVEVHQAAVSVLAGHQPLFVGPGNGRRSLFPLSAAPGIGESSVDVNVVALDDIMAPNLVATLIRIGADGAALDVLDGAKTLINDNPEMAVIVGWRQSPLPPTGRTPRPWLSRFEDLGFTRRVIDSGTGVLGSWSERELEQAGTVNLLFARPGASVWHRAEV